MYTIRIFFERKQFQPVILRKVKPGQTLLEVCLQNNIALSHQCGGVCHCTTCRLNVEKGSVFIEEMSKREKDFLAKTKQERQNSRLACQCLLLDGQGEIEITIPEQP